MRGLLLAALLLAGCGGAAAPLIGSNPAAGRTLSPRERAAEFLANNTISDVPTPEPRAATPAPTTAPTKAPTAAPLRVVTAAPAIRTAAPVATLPPVAAPPAPTPCVRSGEQEPSAFVVPCGYVAPVTCRLTSSELDAKAKAREQERVYWDRCLQQMVDYSPRR
jgi:hypothetical protein